MTKFKMTTREISGEKDSKKTGSVKDSKQMTYARVSQLIQLVKLPEERDRIDQQKLPRRDGKFH